MCVAIATQYPTKNNVKALLDTAPEHIIATVALDLAIVHNAGSLVKAARHLASISVALFA